MQLTDHIHRQHWENITEQLNNQGYACVRNFLTPGQCRQLIEAYHQPDVYRKTITMERYRFGLGEYKYFRYPLPSLIQEIRAQVYPHLAPVANSWMQALQLETRFPASLPELQQQCAAKGQTLPAVLILKYGTGGFNTLHQDLYGEVYFPMQLVLFLNEAGKDYTGGEFVLTEQVPRAQSKAMVLQPGLGDMLLFTTSFRPVKGSKGYYRAHLKHGVSPLHSGQRHTLGIIFHDAAS